MIMTREMAAEALAAMRDCHVPPMGGARDFAEGALECASKARARHMEGGKVDVGAFLDDELRAAFGGRGGPDRAAAYLRDSLSGTDWPLGDYIKSAAGERGVTPAQALDLMTLTDLAYHWARKEALTLIEGVAEMLARKERE